MLTFFNFANSAAIVAGSAIGGAVLCACNLSREAYLALFVLSTVARAAALLLLVRCRNTPQSPASLSVRPLAAPCRSRRCAGAFGRRFAVAWAALDAKSPGIAPLGSANPQYTWIEGAFQISFCG